MVKKDKAIGKIKMDIDLSSLGPTLCSISTLKDKDARLERGDYVKIENYPKQYYVGQVIDGPYYVKDPKAPYEVTYTVDLNSEYRDGVQRTVLDRPIPDSPVSHLEEELTQDFLGTVGNMTIGRLLTQELVKVQLDPMILTRHIGIFGTTGTGKSNTIQTIMEEGEKVGFAVLTFDVEGEYIHMDQPTENLLDLLGIFDYKPKGIKNLDVYVPYPSTSNREDPIRFGITFKDVDRILFSEVAGLSRIEQLFFLDLIDRVEMLLPRTRQITLLDVIERLRGRLSAQADNPTMPPFIAEAHTSLYGKLMAIHNLNMVDVQAKMINVEDILIPGKISIVDFSDATDRLRNIAVANILEKIFHYKMTHLDTPNLLIVLEEAHGFISKEKREEMLATLSFIINIARRGRKRGICLGIVTQQPALLPSELLELCNTRVMHRMSSTSNIEVLRESTGNVPDSMWSILPSLGTGQSLVSSPRYSRSIIVQVRPVASKRMEQQQLFTINFDKQTKSNQKAVIKT